MKIDGCDDNNVCMWCDERVDVPASGRAGERTHKKKIAHKMTNKHYAHKLLLLLLPHSLRCIRHIHKWVGFTVYAHSCGLWRAANVSDVGMVLLRVIKLQYNHICVWFISSAICFVHFSSFIFMFFEWSWCTHTLSLSLCAGPFIANTSFHRWKLSKKKLRARSNWMSFVLCIANAARNYFGMPRVRPVFSGWAFERSTNSPNFTSFLVHCGGIGCNLTKRAGRCIKCQMFDSQTSVCTSSESDEFKLKCKMV